MHVYLSHSPLYGGLRMWLEYPFQWRFHFHCDDFSIDLITTFTERTRRHLESQPPPGAAFAPRGRPLAPADVRTIALSGLCQCWQMVIGRGRIVCDVAHLVHGALAQGLVIYAQVELARWCLHGDCPHLVHGAFDVLVRNLRLQQLENVCVCVCVYVFVCVCGTMDKYN